MIERLPEQEQINVPSNYDLFVLERIENNGRQKQKHQNPLTHDRDGATYVYRSGFVDTPQFNFTAGWSRKAYELIDRVFEKDLTASGLNDFEWRNSWKDLMEGKTTPAISTLSVNICKEGHSMTGRFNSHYLCMSCGQVNWPNPIT